jgi:hypothetical protein
MENRITLKKFSANRIVVSKAPPAWFMRCPSLFFPEISVILSGAKAAKCAERSRKIPSLHENYSLVEPRGSSTPFHPAFALLELRSE